MANTSTVADVKEMDSGDIVKRFEGTIKKLYERKEGKNRKGEWSFQHGFVEDDDGDEIKFTLKLRDEMPMSYKGKRVTFLAHKGKNDSSGLYAKDDEYEGKTTRILLVTATGEIVKGGGGDDSDRDSDRDDRSERRHRDDDDRSERRDRDRDRDRDDDRKDEDPVDAAADDLMRAQNYAGMCYDAACDTLQKVEKRNNVSIPPEAIVSLAATFFIQGAKNGAIMSLPTEPIYENEEPEPEEEKEKEKSSKKRR